MGLLLILLAVYLACLGVFIFTLLFGESVVFKGTIVEKLRWFMTSGIFEGFKYDFKSTRLLSILIRPDFTDPDRVFGCLQMVDDEMPWRL